MTVTLEEAKGCDITRASVRGEAEEERGDDGGGEIDAGEQAEEDAERAADEDGEDVGEAGAVGAAVVDHDDLEGAERGPAHGLVEEIAGEHGDADGEGGAEASAPLHFGERGAEAGDADDRHWVSVDGAMGCGLDHGRVFDGRVGAGGEGDGGGEDHGAA